LSPILPIEKYVLIAITIGPTLPPAGPEATGQTVPEREAAVLDRLAGLIRALFDHDSAVSHQDPQLRDSAWNRQNAMLPLGIAASAAQGILARP
jgi:hypothetical protein